MNLQLKIAYYSVILFILLATLGCSNDPNKNKLSDSYEIYSKIIDSIYNDLTDIYIPGRTMKYSMKDSKDSVATVEFFIEQFIKNVDIHCIEALKDFYLKQNERFYFEDKFISQTQVTILPIDKFEKYLRNKQIHKFKNILFFSQIGFNEAKSEAILCVDHFRNASKWIHLKKNKNEWYIYKVK